MRLLWLAVAVVFIATVAVLTVRDIADHGFNVIDVPAILIVVLFATGILGALVNPPPK